MKDPTPPQPSPLMGNSPPTPGTSHSCDTNGNAANVNAYGFSGDTNTPDSSDSYVKSPERARDADKPPNKRRNTSACLSRMHRDNMPFNDQYDVYYRRNQQTSNNQ